MCCSEEGLEQKLEQKLELELELKLELTLELICFSTILLMKIVSLKAVELLTGAYSVTFRADAF